MIYPKQSCLLWLILHNTVWTGAKALRIGKGDGVCCRCHRESETIPHLFMNCPLNKDTLNWLNALIAPFHPSSLTYKELLLGEMYGLPTSIWNSIRAHYLWNIWLSRNEMLFNGKIKNCLHSLMPDLFTQVEDTITMIKKKIELLEPKHKCHTYLTSKYNV